MHCMTDDLTLLVIYFSYRAENKKCSLNLQILHGQNWELLTFGNLKWPVKQRCVKKSSVFLSSFT